jgi:hypothetical protein
VQELIDASREIMNYTPADLALRAIPGFGILAAADDTGYPSLNKQLDVYEDIIKDDAEAQANGFVGGNVEYLREKHELALAEIQATQDARVEAEKKLLSLRQESADKTNTQNLAYYEELYKMQMKLEEDKLKAQKEYWDWYFKMQAKLRDMNAPSSLGFGLL